VVWASLVRPLGLKTLETPVQIRSPRESGSVAGAPLKVGDRYDAMVSAPLARVSDL
jgi:hypothetical protein